MSHQLAKLCYTAILSRFSHDFFRPHCLAPLTVSLYLVLNQLDNADYSGSPIITAKHSLFLQDLIIVTVIYFCTSSNMESYRVHSKQLCPSEHRPLHLHDNEHFIFYNLPNGLEKSAINLNAIDSIISTLASKSNMCWYQPGRRSKVNMPLSGYNGQFEER